MSFDLQQAVFNALPNVGLVETFDAQTKGNVLENRKMRKQRIVLETKPMSRGFATICVTSLSPISTLPDVGRWKPATMRKTVFSRNLMRPERQEFARSDIKVQTLDRRDITPTLMPEYH